MSECGCAAPLSDLVWSGLVWSAAPSAGADGVLGVSGEFWSRCVCIVCVWRERERVRWWRKDRGVRGWWVGMNGGEGGVRIGIGIGIEARMYICVCIYKFK